MIQLVHRVARYNSLLSGTGRSTEGRPCTDRQRTDRQVYSQADVHAGSCTDRQMYRKAGLHCCKQADIQGGKYTDRQTHWQGVYRQADGYCRCVKKQGEITMMRRPVTRVAGTGELLTFPRELAHSGGWGRGGVMHCAKQVQRVAVAMVPN
jgi:hypothetical protein